MFASLITSTIVYIGLILDQRLSLYIAIAQGGKPGQNARLYYPVRLAVEGHSLYVTEHPVGSQRAIGLASSL